MRLKKISILAILLVFLLPNLAKAETLFLDNNAISNFSDVNTHLVVSEFNTGKIISKRGENKQVSVSNLPNHLALFLLTDDLKNNKISQKDFLDFQHFSPPILYYQNLEYLHAIGFRYDLLKDSSLPH